MIDKAAWTSFFKGYTIFDCAMIREKGIGFVLVEERHDREFFPATRFVNMRLDQPMENRFAVHAEGDFRFTTIAAGTSPLEYVAVDTRSQVYSSGPTRKGIESSIDQLIDMRTFGGQVGTINKVVRVAGQIYALGNYRKIYRRIGPEQWIELSAEGKGVPLPTDVATVSQYSRALGFKDMSAFAADDMYAVGGAGDVWRFDGKHWFNCPLPSNADLMTVCCAADGLVYISELNGSVWAGRADSWTKVADADIAWGFQPVDAFWFNQRLYLGSQEGLWTLDKAARKIVPVQEVEADSPNPSNGGRLDISPDGKFLLTAGPHGACLHDGTGWQRLFSTFDFI